MITVRKAVKEDVTAVAGLEAECFTSPESEATVLSVIESPVYELYIAEYQGSFAGHLIIMTACGSTDILSLAVKNEYRRLGIGGLLLDRLFEDSLRDEISEIFLEVRKSNLSARGLYGKKGFEAIGERKNFYDLPREDAVLMKKTM